MIKAYAVFEPGGELKPFEYDPGPLGADQVEIVVEHCGICHSDLSMIDNEWGLSQYPLVPGHEVIGIVGAVGNNVSHLEVGQRVGLGWQSGYCMSCGTCMSGDHNLCATAEATIVGRHGGFADKVRAQAASVIALPARAPCSAAASPSITRWSSSTSRPMRASVSSASAASVTWPCNSSVPGAAR